MPKLKKIYDEHAQRVFGLAYTYVGNTEDAEEITQDVFIKVYNEYHTFKGSSKLSTWIFRITVNLALDHIKKENRLKRKFTQSKWSTETLPHHASTIESGESYLINQELQEQFESAVQELSDDQRKVFIWQHELGLSTQEIAEILNKSKSSVGSLKHRALEKLQAYFKDHHKP